MEKTADKRAQARMLKKLYSFPFPKKKKKE